MRSAHSNREEPTNDDLTERLLAADREHFLSFIFDS
jgi:hypothetical protein